jgi:hypothetical protein
MRWCALALVAVACRGDATAPDPTPPAATAPPPVLADAAPADAPAPDAGEPGAPLTITTTGVGPLTAATRPEDVRGLVPGLEVAIEHHPHKDGADRPDYDSIWLSEAGERVAELVIESGQVFQIAVDKGMRFATVAGITVGATGNVLAAAYPDLACQFALRHRRAGAIADPRVLSCTSHKLPGVSFELSQGKLKDRRSPIRPAAIASHTIESIVWLAPDRLQALPRTVRTISALGVGPFTAATAMTVDAVRAALPGFEVVAGTRSYGEGFTDDTIDIHAGGETVLRLVHEDGHLSEIRVEVAGFATASGITVGATVRELAGVERDLRCESSMPYDDTWELWCTAPGQPSVQFVVDDDSIRREGSVEPRRIAGRRIAQIIWLPRS